MQSRVRTDLSRTEGRAVLPGRAKEENPDTAGDVSCGSIAALDSFQHGLKDVLRRSSKS